MKKLHMAIGKEASLKAFGIDLSPGFDHLYDYFGNIIEKGEGGMAKTIEEIARIQISEEFLRGMRDRMITSYYKYGDIHGAFPHKIDALGSAMDRVRQYEKTLNTEFLMDAANYLMIEFMIPSLPGAYFRATDSHESPGVIEVGGRRVKEVKD